MSCYKYWGKLEEIANKLSSYGDLDKYGNSELDDINLDEIIESKFDMSIDWTARFKECIGKAVDIRFKEFIKNIHKKRKQD